MSSEDDVTVHHALGRIEAKLDMVLTGQEAHGKRIASLEKRWWISSGATAAAIALLVPKVKALIGL